jgi:hypothetical protein
MKLFKYGKCIVIWFGNTYQQYWDYTITESTKLFKEKYNLKGRPQRVYFCPFIFN